MMMAWIACRYSSPNQKLVWTVLGRDDKFAGPDLDMPYEIESHFQLAKWHEEGRCHWPQLDFANPLHRCHARYAVFRKPSEYLLTPGLLSRKNAYGIIPSSRGQHDFCARDAQQAF
jgi:hypothetical protein